MDIEKALETLSISDDNLNNRMYILIETAIINYRNRHPIEKIISIECLGLGDKYIKSITAKVIQYINLQWKNVKKGYSG